MTIHKSLALILISNLTGRGLCEKGLLLGQGARQMEALTSSISTPRVAPNVDVQSAERGREREGGFFWPGPERPDINSIHIPFASNPL